MLLRGRFDWKSLYRLRPHQRGRLQQLVLQDAGQQPNERRISFFPVQSNLMALAVSDDEGAAHRLEALDPRPDQAVPNAPIWLSIPPSVLNSGQSLPAGTQMFARSLKRAQTVTLAVVPEGKRFAAKLDVRCATDTDAAGLAAELTTTTVLLKELIVREHQTPNPADLSGFLTSGSFRNEGPRVQGYWPMERTLVENLLGGGN